MIEFYEENIKKCETALLTSQDDNQKRMIEQHMRDMQEKLEKEKTRTVAKEDEEQVIGSALRKYEQEAKAKGEIIDPFIKQHLKAKNKIARWTLLIGIAMTCLFKGQWAIWIVMIIIYFVYVNVEKDKAKKADEAKRNK